ncbi:MAG: hypothetical protein NC311_14060, partial [Muribaculaceae bacterium]|nr:hypothetical protein [Muribaculaceae bacterium]
STFAAATSSTPKTQTCYKAMGCDEENGWFDEKPNDTFFNYQEDGTCYKVTGCKAPYSKTTLDADNKPLALGDKYTKYDYAYYAPADIGCLKTPYYATLNVCKVLNGGHIVMLNDNNLHNSYSSGSNAGVRLGVTVYNSRSNGTYITSQEWNSYTTNITDAPQLETSEYFAIDYGQLSLSFPENKNLAIALNTAHHTPTGSEGTLKQQLKDIIKRNTALGNPYGLSELCEESDYESDTLKCVNDTQKLGFVLNLKDNGECKKSCQYFATVTESITGESSDIQCVDQATYKINVTGSAGCNTSNVWWTATRSESSVGQISPSSGSGSGTVTYSNINAKGTSLEIKFSVGSNDSITVSKSGTGSVTYYDTYEGSELIREVACSRNCHDYNYFESTGEIASQCTGVTSTNVAGKTCYKATGCASGYKKISQSTKDDDVYCGDFYCQKLTCPDGYYKDKPNSTYFNYTESNGCYKVTGCKDGYHDKRYGVHGYTYQPTGYTCWKDDIYYLDMYYSTSNAQIMAGCKVGYFNASIPLTITASGYNTQLMPGLKSEITCGVTGQSEKQKVANTSSSYNLSNFRESATYGFTAGGNNVSLSERYPESYVLGVGVFKLRVQEDAALTIKCIDSIEDYGRMMYITCTASSAVTADTKINFTMDYSMKKGQCYAANENDRPGSGFDDYKLDSYDTVLVIKKGTTSIKTKMLLMQGEETFNGASCFYDIDDYRWQARLEDRTLVGEEYWP